jgi:signal transduction histidine kinase
MEHQKVVRKKFMVERGFQIRFMAVIIIAMVLIALVTGMSMYTAVMQTLVNQFHGESLAVIQHAITAKLFVRSLLLIFAIAIISVFISHRIAGPIYKFERIIEALAVGEKVPEITLRKNDEFYRLARAINDLIRKIQGSGNRG